MMIVSRFRKPATPGLCYPPTLQQSLTTRLDRLGQAREMAQIGAPIGRDFSYPLLRAVAGMEDVPLQMALEKLDEADILLRRVYKQDSQIGRKLIQGCKLEISLDSIDVERRPMGTDCTRAVG